MAVVNFRSGLLTIQPRANINKSPVPVLVYTHINFGPFNFPSSGTHSIVVNAQAGATTPLDVIRGFYLDNNSQHEIALQTKDAIMTWRCRSKASIQAPILTAQLEVNITIVGGGVPIGSGEFCDLILTNVAVPPFEFVGS